MAVSGVLGLALTAIFISDAPFGGVLGLFYLGLLVIAGVVMWRSSRADHPRSKTHHGQP